MKKIRIINGHPDKERFNFGITEAYNQQVAGEVASFWQVTC